MVAANKIKFIDISFWYFILAVVLLPIGLGGNRLLPFGLFQGALAFSCLFYALTASEFMPPLFSRLRFALVLFALVILWAIVQTQNFVPPGWLHPMWYEAAKVLQHPVDGAIALSPEDSYAGLSRLITYIIAGLLAYVLAQDARRARQMVVALWLSGVAVCAYGLIAFIWGADTILWIEKTAYQGDLTATFVNRNHFAIYAGLVLVCGAALLQQSWKEKVKAIRPPNRVAALRNWLSGQGGLRILSLVLVFLCIVLSHSRAGLMLSLGGVGCYFFFYLIYRRSWGRAIIIAFSVAAVLGVAFITAQQYSDRFAHLFSDYSSTDRLKVYKLTLQAIGDNPWLGYGLNSFQSIFRLYERGMIMEFIRAHSDLLESLLDLGIPAGLMLWVAIGLLTTGLMRGILYRRRHGMFPCLALAACAMVLGHAIVDFSMQIPGVVVPWAMLLGMGLAQSWRYNEKETVHEWVE